MRNRPGILGEGEGETRMPKVSKKTAKSTSPKAKKPASAPRGKGRGGRRPGVWTLVQPEQIVAYRKEHKLSRLTFAKLVGVSSTTVQNWETGKGAAFPKAQEKIVALLESAPGTGPLVATSHGTRTIRQAPSGSNGQHPIGYDSVVEGTARIVAAFLASAKVGREDLGAVVREVRTALA